MINLASAALKVYPVTKPTGMRKSFNGLCALAMQVFLTSNGRASYI